MKVKHAANPPSYHRYDMEDITADAIIRFFFSPPIKFVSYY